MALIKNIPVTSPLHCCLFDNWQGLEGIAHAGKVDCDAEPHVCNQAGVRAYPSVRLYMGSESGHRQVRLIFLKTILLRFSQVHFSYVSEGHRLGHRVCALGDDALGKELAGLLRESEYGWGNLKFIEVLDPLTVILLNS